MKECAMVTKQKYHSTFPRPTNKSMDEVEKKGHESASEFKSEKERGPLRRGSRSLGIKIPERTLNFFSGVNLNQLFLFKLHVNFLLVMEFLLF